ncbi:MAG: hypothetical protein V4463_20830 [Pseudomonadota bacterium]
MQRITRLAIPALAAWLVLTPAHADSILSRLVGKKTSITRVEFDTPSGSMKVKLTGAIEFTDAEDDVRTIDGHLLIEEKRNGSVQRVEIESEGAHGITRNYSVDGRSAAFEPAGRKWLATVLPAVLRETAMDAPRRVKRLLDKGAADAVLAEIDKIESDYARRIYVTELSNAVTLDDKRLTRLLAATINGRSDYERRTSLNTIMARQKLAPSHQVQVLDGAARLGSDYERRLVMIDLLPKLSGEAPVAAAWQAASNKMTSDYEARLVIEAATKRPMTAPQIDAALQATQGLHSDYERRTALSAIGRHLKTAGSPQVAGYAKSVQGMHSDYERRMALTSLFDQVKLDKAGCGAVLDALEGMNSDYETGQVLMALARQMPNDAELVKRYRKAARTLGDSARGQAERAIDHLGV